MLIEFGIPTGNPVSCSSEISLTLPCTMIPCPCKNLILKAMIPPSTAHTWPSGCDMTTIVSFCVRSTQCCSPGIFELGTFDTSRPSFHAKSTVDAGAIVTLLSLCPDRGDCWCKSGRNPALGTFSLTSASATSQAVYLLSSCTWDDRSWWLVIVLWWERQILGTCKACIVLEIFL